jgi:hypothetical protein
MSGTPSPGRGATTVIVAIAVVVTLAFSWATWAIFLAPRDGGDTVEAFLGEIAVALREADFDAVRARLDPAFSFDPGGLDKEAALAFARSESAAGRFFPYVAFVHAIPGAGGEADVHHVAVLGILAQGDPEKARNVLVRPVRLEVRVRQGRDGFAVLSARATLSR